MKTFDLIATAAFGLEAVVARQVQALGYETTVTSGRVAFQGDADALCRANLWLRSADRVLLKISDFDCRDFDALFETTRGLPWHEMIPSDGAIHVKGRSVRSQLSSVPAVQRTVKKAIVESLMASHGVGELPETGPRFPVEIMLLKDRATLAIDTSGDGLHKRGYRTLTGRAPIRETLAAALVELSFWSPGRPLIDPFCGSGTICIEAAMIGRNIAPGLRRSFLAEQWSLVEAERWQAARAEAEAAIEGALDPRIEGYDLDEQALKLARRHAAQAGVGDDLHFQQRSFRDLSSKRDAGCVVTNPPYGHRLDEEELDAIYHGMPLVFRRLPTWSFFVLTAYPEFERAVGQEADRRRKLYNGRIECTYYQYHGPKPGEAVERGDPAREGASGAVASPSRQAAGEGRTGEGRQSVGARPAFGGLPEGTARQAEEFANRLANRARHLRRWPKRGITCYRLYERDVPDVPLVVDRYEDHLHIGEFERPHDHTIAEHDAWLDRMKQAAARTLDVEPAKVFLKQRHRQRGETQHEAVDDRAYEIEVTEGGLRFLVNLSDYVDTGLFLDHRQTRDRVRKQAKGKRLLNLFCYTGAFTVYAADGEAASTTSVDLSNTYLDWAKRNMKLNGLAGGRHRFIRDDVVTWALDHANGEHYDLAVIDPPTFSNSKSTEEDWRVDRDHGALIVRVSQLMPQGGVIFFSTNYRRFKLDEASLEAAGLSIREISKQTVPEDFRNKRVHRCWEFQKC